MRKPDKEQFKLILMEFAKAKQERFWLDLNLTEDQKAKMMRDFYGDAMPVPINQIPHVAFGMAADFLCRIMDVNQLPKKYQNVIKDYIIAMDSECNANYSIKGYSLETPNELYNFIMKHTREETHTKGEPS